MRFGAAAGSTKEDGSDDDSSNVFESESRRLVDMLIHLESLSDENVKRDYGYSANGDCIIPDDPGKEQGLELKLELTEKDNDDDAIKNTNGSSSTSTTTTTTNRSMRVTSIFFQEYAGISSPSPSDPVQVSEYVGIVVFELLLYSYNKYMYD